ncbi:MAG: hypothetical protein WCI73_02520, partial [Phycisphaerae bacterium]
LSDVEAWGMLQWFNSAKCQPVWTDAELRHKLDDARAAVIRANEVGKRLRSNRPAGHNPLPAWILTLDKVKLRTYKLTILKAIAERCQVNPDGSLSGAIIGFERLAAETGMGVRTCRRHVRNLKAMGLLKVISGGIDWVTGEIKANEYSIPTGGQIGLPSTIPPHGLLGGQSGLPSGGAQ